MSINEDGSGTASTLSAEGLAQLLDWTPPWYAMPVHAEVEYQVQRGLDGKENTVIIGTRGVGKSETVRSAIRRVEARELERAAEAKQSHEGDNTPSLNNPPYPRAILYYEASDSSGTKTALRDLLKQLKRRVTPSEVRNWTPTEFVERAVEQLRRRCTHLVCIDEAQFINPDNLEHLRQVSDLARAEGYPLGLVLVGDHRLRDRLAATGQLGQRYTGIVEFPRFETLAGELEQWHPHLAQLKADIKTKQWRQLKRELALAANGSFRRLVAVLENANALAIRLNRPLYGEVLAMAIDKLAPEA